MEYYGSDFVRKNRCIPALKYRPFFAFFIALGLRISGMLCGPGSAFLDGSVTSETTDYNAGDESENTSGNARFAENIARNHSERGFFILDYFY